MQLLDNDTTTEVLTNGQVSGYVYAWDDDGVQIQEWVLFESFEYPNHSRMTLQAVTDRDWEQATLEGFAAQIRRAHEAGRDWLFARAVARRPDREFNLEELERQVDPQNSVPEDTECGNKRVRISLFNGAGELVGFVYARGNEPRSCADRNELVEEFWVLFPGYKSAPGATVEARPDEHLVGTNEIEAAAQLIIENSYNRFERAMARLERVARIAL